MKTFKALASVSALVTVLALSAGAHAATISGLYSTGVDNSGVATTGAAADLHWQLNEGAAYTGATNGSFPIGPWVADSTSSRWLTPSANAADSYDPSAPGFYTYSTSFNLASTVGAAFTGQFAADNTVVEILLNGNLIGSGGGFSSWTNFAATSGDFLSGKNTLDFVVENYAQNGGNPTGLDVQILSSNMAGGVPEPATWALSILGVGLTGLALRRAKQPVLA